LDGELVSTYASQGQVRSIILAWKTAEMDLLNEAHGDPPIMLLDDVSSELDEARNLYLFDYLSQRGSQTFITTTHPGHVKLTNDRVDYKVQIGTISIINS
jgi:DNA replication and repair protein RecF